MAGSSIPIRNALVFGLKTFEHQAHVKALLNQGCKVVLFARDVSEAQLITTAFENFSLSKMDEIQDHSSESNADPSQPVLE